MKRTPLMIALIVDLVIGLCYFILMLTNGFSIKGSLPVAAMAMVSLLIPILLVVFIGFAILGKKKPMTIPGSSGLKGSGQSAPMKSHTSSIKVVAHEYDGTVPLKVGDIVHPDDITLGRCIVEQIQINPDGRGDKAFVRAERAVSPLEYESEPGDPTLYQFRSKFLEDQAKRAR